MAAGDLLSCAVTVVLSVTEEAARDWELTTGAVSDGDLSIMHRRSLQQGSDSVWEVSGSYQLSRAGKPCKLSWLRCFFTILATMMNNASSFTSSVAKRESCDPPVAA